MRYETFHKNSKNQVYLGFSIVSPHIDKNRRTTKITFLASLLMLILANCQLHKGILTIFLCNTQLVKKFRQGQPAARQIKAVVVAAPKFQYSLIVMVDNYAIFMLSWQIYSFTHGITLLSIQTHPAREQYPQGNLLIPTLCPIYTLEQVGKFYLPRDISYLV